GNVFPLDEPFELIKARLRFLDRLQGELVRNDREIRETPFPPLHVQLARETELDEMTDRGRDDVVLVLEVVLDFFEATESASEIVRDAGFLGDDERFGHCRWGKLAGPEKQRDFCSPVFVKAGRVEETSAVRKSDLLTS